MLVRPEQMLLAARIQTVRGVAAISLANGQAQAATAPTFRFISPRTPIAIVGVHAHYDTDVGTTKEQQTLTNNASATTGDTFKIRIVNPVTGVTGTTDAIAYNASAATVLAELEALPDTVVIAGEIGVARSGTTPEFVWTLTLGGRFARSNPAAVTVATGPTYASFGSVGTYASTGTITVATSVAWADTTDTTDPTFYIGIGRPVSATELGVLNDGSVYDIDAIGTLVIPRGLKGDVASLDLPSEFASTLIPTANQYPDALGYPVVPAGTGVWTRLFEDLASGSGTVSLSFDYINLADNFNLE